MRRHGAGGSLCPDDGEDTRSDTSLYDGEDSCGETGGDMRYPMSPETGTYMSSRETTSLAA